ncbi:MAG: ABC transporter ATP-binding protein [Methylacidiphilales bacterium]|nr:ABC transporter ATP-binding protein [Candidatus Methylacidiphilales bacterium]
MINNLNETKTYITFSQVSFKRANRYIFENLSLSVPKGKIVGILGSSGCGKTTLLKLMSGQLSPDQGTVLYGNKNIHKISSANLFEIRKKIGMLFQSGALLNDLSVFENVAFPLREHTKLPEPVIVAQVLLKLQSVGLRGAATLFPSELSGGMTRRVALARAIVMDPELLLYDEPFAGQDPISMGVLLKLISELNSLLGLTSVIVSHDVTELLSIADYIYAISDATIIASGTPSDFQTTSNPWVRQFVHSSAEGAVQFDYHAKLFKEQFHEII